MDRREAIARIIDPDAWTESFNEDGSLDPIGAPIFEEALAESLAKAEQIEALFAEPLGDEEQGISSSSPVLPTRPSGLTETPYSDGEVLAIQLESIRLQLARWIQFNTEERAREGLTSDADTMISAPPFWPSHGQLENWIKAIRGAEEVVSK